MDFGSPIFNLYNGYLIGNQGQSSSTGLSHQLEGEITRDKIKHNLNFSNFGSKELWPIGL
jgi:hypothetical protein